MLLFMAGLQNIPRELEEAAMIDGANRWQSVWHVTVPLLVPPSAPHLPVCFGLAHAVQPVWIMTRGGPVNASEMMATYMYRYAFIVSSSVTAQLWRWSCWCSAIFSVAYQWLNRQPDP